MERKKNKAKIRDLPMKARDPKADQIKGGRARRGGGDEDDDLSELEVQR